jgi:hypothetical protein
MRRPGKRGPQGGRVFPARGRATVPRAHRSDHPGARPMVWASHRAAVRGATLLLRRRARAAKAKRRRARKENAAGGAAAGVAPSPGRTQGRLCAHGLARHETDWALPAQQGRAPQARPAQPHPRPQKATAKALAFRLDATAPAPLTLPSNSPASTGPSGPSPRQLAPPPAARRHPHHPPPARRADRPARVRAKLRPAGSSWQKCGLLLDREQLAEASFRASAKRALHNRAHGQLCTCPGPGPRTGAVCVGQSFFCMCQAQQAPTAAPTPAAFFPVLSLGPRAKRGVRACVTGTRRDCCLCGEGGWYATGRRRRDAAGGGQNRRKESVDRLTAKLQ